MAGGGLRSLRSLYSCLPIERPYYEQRYLVSGIQ